MNKKIIFVSDIFSDQYQGGAELTLESIIEKCPYEYVKKNSSSLDFNFINENLESFWVFGNFFNLKREFIIYLIKKQVKYAVFEYDYKFCNHRSVTLHKIKENKPCDCFEKRNGKEVALFFHKSSFMCWMSNKQKEFYEKLFPFLKNHKNSHVISSTFSERDTLFIKSLNSLGLKKNDTFLILNSRSWIKGTAETIEEAKKQNIKYELVSNLKRHEILRKMSQSKGLMLLPLGKDTCPRIVIEAKLLGCELILNDNVLHTTESWFQKTTSEILDYLNDKKHFFWSTVEGLVNE